MRLQHDRDKHFYLVLILHENLLSPNVVLLFFRHLFGAFVNMHIPTSSGGLLEISRRMQL